MLAIVDATTRPAGVLARRALRQHVGMCALALYIVCWSIILDCGPYLH
jgi:hypothetical protein